MMATDEARAAGTTAPDDDKQAAWDDSQDNAPAANQPDVAADNTSEQLTRIIDVQETPAARPATPEEPLTNAAPTDHRAVEEPDDLVLEALPVPAAVVRADTPAEAPASTSESGAANATTRPPTPRSLSMAEIWATTQTQPKLPVRIAATGIIGMATLAASTWLWTLWNSFSTPAISVPSLELVLANAPAATQRDAWLQDVLAAKHQAPQAWDPAVPEIVPLSPQRVQTTVEAPRRPLPPRRARAKSNAPPPVLATPTAEADDFYGSIFGSAERYQAASRSPSSRAESRLSAAAQGPDVEGIVLQARLQDEVASDPAGAPVIAVIRRRAKIGATTLPAGSELHGRVTGSTDTRIFVDFQFARSSEGGRIDLQGSARDENGRAGIPSKKMFTKRTAGSIGVASASKAVQEAGRAFAGSLGSILGAGLEGATDAGVDKAKRADRDEYVVIAPRGASLAVYVKYVAAAT